MCIIELIFSFITVVINVYTKSAKYKKKKLIEINNIIVMIIFRLLTINYFTFD